MQFLFNQWQGVQNFDIKVSIFEREQIFRAIELSYKGQGSIYLASNGFKGEGV